MGDGCGESAESGRDQEEVLRVLRHVAGPKQHFTSSGRLASSAIWNLTGMLLPMLVAVVAIPLLIDGMGKERFGLLTIVWMGVGYFSLFDLGLGRALTKIVCERLGKDVTADVGALVWSALAALAALGLLGATLLVLFSPALVISLLNVSSELRDEAITALRVLALGVPIVILTAGLVGLLEARQRFATIAMIRGPLGILTFAGPLLTLQFSPSIVGATAALLISRLIALIVYFYSAARAEPALNVPQWLKRQELYALLNFGGWLTVTNIVGPLMTYLDRFLISAQLGLTSVAYYVTPYEVLSRIQMLPQAIMGVLFPAMATEQSQEQRLVALYVYGGKVVCWTMLPITAGFFLLAPEALLLWLGEDFRQMATPVVQWLAAGWMINTLAHPALTVLQSTGRPDLVAKTHLAELLPYLAVLWWLAASYGIAGVAAAWTLRVVVDSLMLNALAAWHIPALRVLMPRIFLTILVTLGVFAGMWLIDELIFRLVALLVLSAIAGTMLWPIIRKALN